MRIYITIVFWLVCSFANAQNISLRILPSSGVIAHNAITNAADKILMSGWSIINSVDLRLDYKFSRISTINSSIGYMHSYNAGIEPGWGTNALTNYTSIKIGYFYFLNKRHKLGFNVSNYLLLDQKENLSFQRKYFGNIDLLYEMNITDVFSIGISSPITFSPYASYTANLGPNMDHNLWSEWIGLQIYLGIKLF